MTLQTQFPTTFFHTPTPPNPPVADFTYEDNGDQTVTFIDASTNYPTSWLWDFGDGSATATQQSPSHTYESAGPHTVTLTVTNADGSDSTSQSVTVTLAPPIAHFTYQNNGDLSVTFTDASLTQASGTAIDSWSWDFGDESGTSTQQNPTHTFASEDDYSVTLTVTDTYGNTDDFTSTVTVAEHSLPVASFTYEDNGDQTVTFTDTSTNSPMSWSWDFGDGSALSTSQNPTHVFEGEGPWSVTLTITNGAGNDSDTQSVSVDLALPTVSFSYTDNEDLSVTFNGTAEATASGAEIVYWEWDFGDSSSSSEEDPEHLYDSADTYTVELTVTDSYGNQNTHSASVSVTLPTLAYPTLGSLARTDFVYYWYAGDGNARNTTVETLGDGELVTAWTSQGSNTLTLQQTNLAHQPTFRRTVPELGGLSGIEFNSDFLTATVASSPTASLNQYSIYVLVSNFSSSLGGYAYSEGSTSSTTPKIWVGFVSTNNDVTGRHQGSSAATATGGNFTEKTAHVITFQRTSATDFQIYIDNTLGNTATNTVGTTTLNRVTIGALFTGASTVANPLLGWVNFVGVRDTINDRSTIVDGLLAMAQS